MADEKPSVWNRAFRMVSVFLGKCQVARWSLQYDICTLSDCHIPKCRTLELVHANLESSEGFNHWMLL